MSSPRVSRTIRSVDVVVAHGDEVRPRRVERIGEDARFTDERPPIWREHARTAVREMLQGEKVLELASMRLDHLGALRLELAQPVERPLEAIEASKRVQAASATMPTLVLPEPSGISHTQ